MRYAPRILRFALARVVSLLMSFGCCELRAFDGGVQVARPRFPQVVVRARKTDSRVLAFSIALLGFLVGCQRERPRKVDTAIAEADVTMKSRRGTRTVLGRDLAARIVMSHDFKLMEPNQTATHEFVVRNSSQSLWHLSQIVSSCGCAVVRRSSDFIDPQSSGSFEVQFTASVDRPGSKTSLITLIFDGAPGAEVKLRMTAEIRDSLEVSPNPVRFTIADGVPPASQLLTVENHGDEPWSSIKVRPSVDWLEAHVPVPARIHDGGRTKQRWVAVLDVKRDRIVADERASGAIAYLDVCVDGCEQTVRVPVVLVKRRPVSCHPSSIALGRVVAGESTEKRIIVRFNVGHLEFCPDDICVRLKSGRELALQRHEWEELAPPAWRLSLSLIARQVESPPVKIVRDEIILRFPESSGIQKVSVDVSSRISNPRAE